MASAPPLELDAQYRQLREEAGLLRRSDRGLVAVTGSDCAEYLQGQLTNDVEALAVGEGRLLYPASVVGILAGIAALYLTGLLVSV